MLPRISLRAARGPLRWRCEFGELLTVRVAEFRYCAGIDIQRIWFRNERRAAIRPWFSAADEFGRHFGKRYLGRGHGARVSFLRFEYTARRALAIESGCRKRNVDGQL